jgi:hypothetical protein
VAAILILWRIDPIKFTTRPGNFTTRRPVFINRLLIFPGFKTLLPTAVFPILQFIGFASECSFYPVIRGHAGQIYCKNQILQNIISSFLKNTLF